MKKLIISLLFVPMMAHAEFLNGNQLHMRLQSTDTIDRVYGIGYVVGIYDANVKIYFCPNENGLTVGQITDIVKNYLAANPSIRNAQAYELVTNAFKNIWPCAANRTPGRGA